VGARYRITYQSINTTRKSPEFKRATSNEQRANEQRATSNEQRATSPLQLEREPKLEQLAARPLAARPPLNRSRTHEYDAYRSGSIVQIPPMPSFKDLQVWQKARGLLLRIDVIVKRIQRHHPRLADQLGRSAESVPACIAEGRGRSTDRDFAHYVSMAIGSVCEVENHLQRCLDVGAVSGDEHETLTESAIEVRKMLIGLLKKLREA
jgi:four helix bundle protein